MGNLTSSNRDSFSGISFLKIRDPRNFQKLFNHPLNLRGYQIKSIKKKSFFNLYLTFL